MNSLNFMGSVRKIARFGASVFIKELTKDCI